jgi:hypothetical protein
MAQFPAVPFAPTEPSPRQPSNSGRNLTFRLLVGYHGLAGGVSADTTWPNTERKREIGDMKKK